MTLMLVDKKEERSKIWMCSLIGLLIGFLLGIIFAGQIIKSELSDAVKVKGIVIKSIPYELKEKL